MKKPLRIIILLGIIGLLIGGAVAYYMYNKPHVDVAGMDPHHTETAVSLLEKVKDIDLSKPNEYTDKIVLVTGTVAKIDHPNDSVLNIFLTIDEMGMNNVVCAMDVNLVDGSPLAEGQEVKVKGIFTGVNKFEDPDFGINTTDIMLSRCVVEK